MQVTVVNTGDDHEKSDYQLFTASNQLNTNRIVKISYSIKLEDTNLQFKSIRTQKVDKKHENIKVIIVNMLCGSCLKTKLTKWKIQ